MFAGEIDDTCLEDVWREAVDEQRRRQSQVPCCCCTLLYYQPCPRLCPCPYPRFSYCVLFLTQPSLIFFLLLLPTCRCQRDGGAPGGGGFAPHKALSTPIDFDTFARMNVRLDQVAPRPMRCIHTQSHHATSN